MAAVLSSRMSPRQRAAVERCAALAVSRGLRIVGRGVCRVPGRFQGAPVWAVSSATVPGLCHLVWSFRGALLCSCPAGRRDHIVTCSHAECVRLSLLAERGAVVGASVPAPSPAPSPAAAAVASSADRVAGVASEVAAAAAEQRAARGLPPSGPVCPSCGAACSARELAELGECLDCVAARGSAPVAGGPVHCPRCGAEGDADELATRGMCEPCAVEAARGRAEAAHAKRRALAAAGHVRIRAAEEARQAAYAAKGRAHDERRIPGALPPVEKPPRDVRELMPLADNRPASQWMWK